MRQHGCFARAYFREGSGFSSYECRRLFLWFSPGAKWLIRKGAVCHLMGLPTVAQEVCVRPSHLEVSREASKDGVHQDLGGHLARRQTFFPQAT